MSLPSSDYGHPFREEVLEAGERAEGGYTASQEEAGGMERAWLVGHKTRVRHVSALFDAAFARDHDAWSRCSVVLGMHPDEATEDIVDLALKDAKPFAVTPCCVFPNQNPHRHTADGRPVRSYEEFCEYLAAKVRGWGVYCYDFRLLPIAPSVS